MDTLKIRNDKAVFNDVEYDFDKLPKNVVFYGDIDLSWKKISLLPDMSTWIVRGYFNCNNTKIISLRGCPKEVDDDFDCYNNCLSSLRGCPEKIGGYFDCSHNNLKSLEYSPKKVSGCFNCSHNNLKSLEYCPEEVEYFICSYNRIEVVDSWPEHINNEYSIHHNPIKSIKEGVVPLKYLIEFYKKGWYNSKELLMGYTGCFSNNDLLCFLSKIERILWIPLK